MKFSPEDHARIAAAVTEAERGTSGEIRCVLAQTTADGRHTALSWATAAALVLPAAALLLGFRPQALSQVFGGWSIGQMAARDSQIATAIAGYILIQAVVFVVVWLIASLAAVRRLLTPAALAERRVHAMALEQFTALGLQRTRDHTGILLFASLADRRAQVLADEGIYAKAPPAVWDEVVGLLIDGLRRETPADGFVAAIERTGRILADVLPPRSDDANELSDGIVESGS